MDKSLHPDSLACQLIGGFDTGLGSTEKTSECTSGVLYSPLRLETDPRDEDDGYYDFPIAPPLSSSPPDFESSSPRSAGSEQGSSSSSAVSWSPGTSLLHPDSGALPTLDLAFSDSGSTRRHAILLEATLKPIPGQDVADVPLNSKVSDPVESLPTSLAASPFVPSHYFIGHQSSVCDVRGNSLEAVARTSPAGYDDDVSPMRFASSTNSPARICPGSPAHQGHTYRVIKRATSYMRMDPHDDCEPLPKRQKVVQDSAAHSQHRLYAHRAASLRRAESLKSMSELEAQILEEGVPTAPATPVAMPSNRTQSHPQTASINILLEPVPIIAPPEDYVPGLPLSTEASAKLRIRRFLEREAAQREIDGLSELQESPIKGRTESDQRLKWEGVLGIGRARRLNAINWILDVLPDIPEQVTPASSQSTVVSGQRSGSSSGSSATNVAECQPVIYNLFDQLRTSHETRFHASWMFLRYFYLTLSHIISDTSGLEAANVSRTSSFDSQSSTMTEHEGRDLIVWDIAVACLSLSVKFHRDFLDPLLPVYAHEYLALSPHGMAPDDLENAHRDILAAFNYRLGDSPQLLMNELWVSLPSLRELMAFVGGWNFAMEDAWLFLFDAICEPDILQFSISVLTTAAILDGVMESLVHKFRLEDVTPVSSSPLPQLSQRRLVGRGHVGNSEHRTVLESRAREEAEGVLADIQALVGVSDAQLEECRAWMS